ncbi:MAG: LysR family transcriptional regulator [Clostridia bacterium]|nr:LysR family transcriptional regulator [Clostridia bacterium]
MELLQLRYFLEVARTQHITKSAEKLHIAQPSLSQAIKRLENELGVKLFAARGRNIVLTEYGKFFRDRLEPLIQRLDALPDQLREMADPDTATICLHVTAASLIVSEAIIEYRRLRPKTNFRFLLGEDASLFDVSISAERASRDQLTPPEDLFTCNEKICIAVPNSDRYENISSVRLAALRDVDFISLDSRKQFRQICDQLCAEAGFSPRIAFESDSPDTVRNMIAAHMGVGFWPAFSWGRPGDMKLIDITEPICRRSIVIRKQKNRMHSQVIEEFFAFLCDRFMAKMTEAYGIG